ncbi:MAG: SWIB/MDM2 domain-containing protein [Bacteriovoracaceae bacterium]|jgi:hypothetical protein|nr:SWIB/MDM2 domain-containing protein [Bacteriovoracaceae bacterium]
MSKDISEVKVLNVAQPNAHNIIFNGKNVENRSMATHIRGTIAIYASATYQKKRFEKSKVQKEECSFGCIIGFVDVVDCIVEEEVTAKTKKWFFGEYGYVLKNVRVLKKPIKVKPPKGAVIWWNLDGKLMDECLKQIDLKSFKQPKKIDSDPSKPKAKRTVRSLLQPSKELSKIVGSEPLKMSKIIEKLTDYLNERELIWEEDKTLYFETNKDLKAVFKVKVFNVRNLKKVLEEHTTSVG